MMLSFVSRGEKEEDQSWVLMAGVPLIVAKGSMHLRIILGNLLMPLRSISLHWHQPNLIRFLMILEVLSIQDRDL